MTINKSIENRKDKQTRHEKDLRLSPVLHFYGKVTHKKVLGWGIWMKLNTDHLDRFLDS